MILVLVILALVIQVDFLVAQCQQPPVRNCNAECSHLQSYPTFEKEACITVCVDDDLADRAAYSTCLDDEAEAQQAADEQAALEAAEKAAEEEAAAKKAEEAAEAAAAEEAAKQAALDAAQKAADEQAAQDAADEAARKAAEETPQDAEEPQDAEIPQDVETPQDAETPQNVARVGKLEGEAFLVINGKSTQITKSSTFKNGDIIRTGKGTVTFTFDDGSKIRLGPNSVLRFEDQKEARKFRLTTGYLKAFIKKVLSQRWEIRTPFACACVRGTEFILSHNEDTGQSVIHLTEGELDVIPENGDSEVTIEGTSVVIEDAGIVDTHVTTEQELGDANALLTLSQEEDGGSSVIIYVVIIVVVLVAGVYFMSRRNKKK